MEDLAGFETFDLLQLWTTGDLPVGDFSTDMEQRSIERARVKSERDTIRRRAQDERLVLCDCDCIVLLVYPVLLCCVVLLVYPVLLCCVVLLVYPV